MFSKIILKESQGFPEVHVLFDRYDELSLKCKDCTCRIQIQYKIEDDTNIESTTSENFLSHVNTKRGLTKYLNHKIAQVFSASGKQYVVVYNSTAESNIIDFPDELTFHSHEEVDFLVVLDSIDVAKNCQLYVACSDTDVLLLFLYFYSQICNNTIFHAITQEIDVGCAYNALGNKKSMAPSSTNTLRQLRWYLFSKFQYDSEKLPSTSSAPRFAIYRSHLVCNT